MATEGTYTYKYPRPGLTVDTVLVSRAAEESPAKILLVRRKFPPCKDMWALPGGFVDEQERLDVAARRELREETSLDPESIPFAQVGAFAEPHRDPRGWTVSAVYAGVLPAADESVKGQDDAAEAKWISVENLPKLAFDHKIIVGEAFNSMAGNPYYELDNLTASQLKLAADHLAQLPWIPPTE